MDLLQEMNSNLESFNTKFTKILLQKSVKFQGSMVSLIEIMSAGSPAANLRPVCVLLEQKELTVAYPVPIANAHNEIYLRNTLSSERY